MKPRELPEVPVHRQDTKQGSRMFRTITYKKALNVVMSPRKDEKPEDKKEEKPKK